MPDTPPSIVLSFFDGFSLASVSNGSDQTSGLGKKAQGLLAYLARSNGHTANREKLAALLWDDRGEQQARQSLRQAISSIRKTLSEMSGQEGSAILKSDGDGLGLDTQLCQIDVVTFEGLADTSETANLANALSLFSGEFLADIGSVSDSFDGWLVTERRHLNDIAAQTMDRLAKVDSTWAASTPAKEVADRLAGLDPFCEPPRRVLITNALLNGQTATANRYYREFKDLLSSELDTEPETDTQALFDTIQALENSNTSTDPAPTKEATSERHAQPLTPRQRIDKEAATSDVDVPSPTMVYPAQPVQIESDVSGFRAGPKRFLIGAILLLVFVGIATLLNDRFRESSVSPPAAEIQANSISIQPFRAIGSDERTDVISSGLYEGLSSAMTMIGDISVVMDASSVRGLETQTSHHLLEGSVQTAGNRIRITANLTNTQTSERVWSQLYERPLDDIVAVQNNITLSLLKALQVELSDGEQARVRPINETDNIEAWLLAANALQHVRQLSPEQMERARALYREALSLDPDYSSAKTGLAWTHTVDLLFGWSPAPDEARTVVKEAAAFLRKSDPYFPFGHTLQALSDLMEGKHRAAKRNGLRGVKLMPASAEANALYAYILTFTGDYDEAITLTNRAIDLSPAKRHWIHWNLARALRLNGVPAGALDVLNSSKPAGASSPVYYVELATTLMQLKRTEEAKTAAKEVVAIIPDFSVSRWVDHPPHANRSVSRAESELLISIGLPE